MTPFNFLETKIDVPALDRRAARRPQDSAPNEDGGEFDRLVAHAAKEHKGRSEGATDCSALSSDDVVQDQQPSDTAIGTRDAVAINGHATLQTSDTTPMQVAPAADISLAATVAAALLPASDRAIWLPANIAVPAAEHANTVVAANLNLKAAPQGDASEPLAAPVASAAAGMLFLGAQTAGMQVANAPEANADLAASVADLFEMDLQIAGSQTRQSPVGLPQTAAAAIKAAPQFAVAPGTAANADTPAAGLVLTSEASAVPVELTSDTTAAIRPKESPSLKPAADDALTAQADLTTASTASKIDTTAMPMARDFVREVATHYQATAEAGASSRAAGDPAPAEQISIRLLHSLHEGRKAVQIHLHPSELGSIEVSMQWKGDRLTAHFVVDRPETLDLIQRDIRILEQSLGDSGFKSDNGGLSFSLRQQSEGQSERRSGNGSPSSDRTQNAAPETPADEPSTIRDGVLVLRV